MALNKWATAIICSWLIFGIMATIAVALRLWSRRIQKLHLMFNDYAIIMALVWTYGLFAISLIYIFRSGLGDNEQDVPVKDLIILFKNFAPGATLWALANTFVKYSILHLYICLFPRSGFLRAAYITMALTTAYIVFVVISSFTICHPFSYFWDKMQDGHCGDQIALYMTGGIFNLILDVTVVVLPMPMLWGLQMPRGKKVALTGVFGLGAGICIISILRIKYLKDLNPHNITYSVAPEGLFTLLEPTLGIISACLPVIRPVIVKLSKKPTIPTSSEYFASKASRAASARHSSHGPNGGFAPKKFQRLDDHAFPLTNRYGNFNDIGGPENDACSGDQDVEEQAYVSDPGDRKNAVVVNTKSGWDIHDNVV